jgi:DNA-binding transcriptional regulator YiaG
MTAQQNHLTRQISPVILLHKTNLSLIFDRKNMMDLKQLRHRKKLKQEQLADALGVDLRLIVRWEGGKGLPSVPNLLKLMDVLGPEVLEVFRGRRGT